MEGCMSGCVTGLQSCLAGILNKNDCIVLSVKVQGAKDLKDADSCWFRKAGDKSDPYATVKLNDMKLYTNVVDDCLNPVWEDKLLPFELENSAGTFEVYVRDKDNLGKDDELGRAKIDLSRVPEGSWANFSESLGPGKGTIQFQARVDKYDAAKGVEIKAMRKQLEKEKDDEFAEAMRKAEKGSGDMVIVCIVAARGLKNTDSGLFKRASDMSDAYTMVRVGGKKARTKTIKDCLDPVWDSEWFSFSLRPGSDKQLKFDLYDYDALSKDDPLGTSVIDYSELTPGVWNDLQLPLEEPTGVNKLKDKINQAYMLLKVHKDAQDGMGATLSSGGALAQIGADAVGISGWGQLEVKVRIELMESHRMDKVDVKAQMLMQQQDDKDKKERGGNAAA